MTTIDLARTFFANIDAGDVNGTLALIAPHANVSLVPLQLQGNVEEVGRDYFQQLANAFPDLKVRVRRLFVGSQVPPQRMRGLAG